VPVTCLTHKRVSKLQTQVMTPWNLFKPWPQAMRFAA
jgi:hypothetical protein